MMKSFTSLFLVCFCLNTNAQINKKTFSIGSNLIGSYSSGGVNNYSYYTIKYNVEPNFEYFIKKNLSLGTGLGYNYEKTNQETKITDLNFLNNTYKEYFRQFIFIKKYWFIQPKFALSANGAISSMLYKYTFIDELNLKSNRDIPSLWSFSAQLNFGCTYLFNPKLSISMQTSILQFYKSPNNSSSSPNPLDHSIDFFDPSNRLIFGINYFIGKNEKL